MKKKLLLKNMLNSNGLKVEPFGDPAKISVQSLNDLFTLVL